MDAKIKRKQNFTLAFSNWFRMVGAPPMNNRNARNNRRVSTPGLVRGASAAPRFLSSTGDGRGGPIATVWMRPQSLLPAKAEPQRARRQVSLILLRNSLLMLVGFFTAMLPSLLVASDAPTPANSSASHLRLTGPLQFTPPVVTVSSTLDDDAIFVKFSFTNSSSDKVTILNVHPLCGCTSAEINKHE